MNALGAFRLRFYCRTLEQAQRLLASRCGERGLYYSAGQHGIALALARSNIDPKGRSISVLAVVGAVPSQSVKAKTSMAPAADKPEPGRDPLSGSDAQFPVTHWSLVVAAANPEDASGAMEKLARAYWPPIYAFLRHHGRSPHDAQDLCQEFFLRLISKRSFSGADPKKGKFRYYLLAALKHFLADEWDRAHAQKRGGQFQFLSLDDTQNAERYYLQAMPSDETPEKLFNRRWGLMLLEKALARLRAEHAARGYVQHFDLLKPFLTAKPTPGGYDDVAGKLGITPSTVAVHVHRLRQRFRELVRAEVAETVTHPSEVDEELHALFS